MKLRDTVILVVLAHVGLVLVWICMGGCSSDKAQEPKKEVAAITSEEPGTELPPTQVNTNESASPIVVQERTLPPLDIALPDTRGGASPATTRGTTPETGTVTPATAPSPSGTTTEAAPQEIKYVVKKGDTLWALGRKFKVPVSAIVDRNDIQDAAVIREGRELIIPVAQSAAPAPETPAARAPSGSAAEARGPSALLAGVEAVPVAEDAQNAVHRVQPGDTVWKLARLYNTTSTRILEANNIGDPTRIQIGQELRIPKQQ